MLEYKENMYKVTPSGIGTLLECPRCLWLLANEKVERPRGIFPSLPNGMDEVFKAYFDTYRGKEELPPEIAGKVEGAKLFADLERLKPWRESDFGRGGLKAEFPDLDVRLQGAIDELLVAADGRYIAFDFKTRGYETKEDTHEHYQHQLDLYALLFERNNLPPSLTGYLLFFWPKQYVHGAAEFETELVRMSVDPARGIEILRQVHEIATGQKPASHSACKYCLYRGEL